MLHTESLKYECMKVFEVIEVRSKRVHLYSMDKAVACEARRIELHLICIANDTCKNVIIDG